jgi:Ca-activated chloride channel family protein
MMEGFGFLSPGRLVWLVVPLALAVGYLLVQSHRRRYALRFTTVEMLDEVAPDRPGWRRHLPALGLVAAVVVATIAFARPVIAGESRESVQLVVLAIDTSLSMAAVDVSPSRVDAAREAAGSFLDSVPPGVAVGVVGFDGEARQLIAPTTRLESVRRIIDGAIDENGLGEGTAIGEAIFLGIEAIESSSDGEGPSEDGAAAGSIVVLSDGETTVGRSNEEAASAARQAGVPVNTIAFGTAAGTVEGPLGEVIPVPVNRQALEELAADAGGRSLTAATAEELSQVYADLGKSVKVETEQVEIADRFIAVALAVLALAGLASLLWFGRLP